MPVSQKHDKDKILFKEKENLLLVMCVVYLIKMSQTALKRIQSQSFVLSSACPLQCHSSFTD